MFCVKAQLALCGSFIGVLKCACIKIWLAVWSFSCSSDVCKKVQLAESQSFACSLNVRVWLAVWSFSYFSFLKCAI